TSSLLSLPAPPHPPSSPTRRSSDLSTAAATPRPCPRAPNAAAIASAKPAVIIDQRTTSGFAAPPAASCAYSGDTNPTTRRIKPRSEEHTSELQSRVDLVCRLLLEKK